LEVEGRRCKQWHEWVATAKPDDSLLQTLGAIAEATRPNATEIEIQSLEIQLQREYPDRFKQPPRWAAPQLAITAEVNNGVVARSWLDRLTASDRIEDAASRIAPGVSAEGAIQINAIPLATRWVP
jgi:hypothetical protein